MYLLIFYKQKNVHMHKRKHKSTLYIHVVLKVYKRYISLHWPGLNPSKHSTLKLSLSLILWLAFSINHFLSIFQSVYVSMSLPLCLCTSVCISISLSLSMSVWLSVWLSLSLCKAASPAERLERLLVLRSRGVSQLIRSWTTGGAWSASRGAGLLSGSIPGSRLMRADFRRVAEVEEN